MEESKRSIVDNIDGAQLPRRKRSRTDQHVSSSPPSVQSELQLEPRRNSQASTVATVTPPRTHSIVSTSVSTPSAETRKSDGLLSWLSTLPRELFDPISNAYMKFWYQDGKPTLQNLINDMRRHDEASVLMLLSRRDYILSINNVDLVDEHDWTPLHFAALYGSSNEIIELLVDCGVDIMKINSLGQTAVHRAIRSRNIRIVKLLLDHLSIREIHKVINSKDQHGLKALHHAAMFCDEEMVELLIDRYGAIVDTGYERKTPLHAAIEQNNKQMVPVLLEYGADIHRENKLNDKTALHYAVERGDKEMVEMILKESRDISTHHAGRKRKRGDIDKVAFIERPDCQGRSALIWAVHRRHAGIVQLLLKYGANINYKTRLRNQTAFHVVSIIGRGTGSSSDGEGGFCCCERMIRLLADNGGDVNAQDSNGMTPLHYLAQRQSKELMVRLLIERYHADVTLQSNDGHTPADVAEASLGSSHAISQLLRHHFEKVHTEDSQQRK